VVVVFVREEYGVEFAEWYVRHLLAEVWSAVEEDAIAVGFN
jgi:hypothetical protein